MIDEVRLIGDIHAYFHKKIDADEGLYYEVHVLAWMPLPDPYQT